MYWERKGDQERAISQLDEAIQRDPKLAVAYQRRAQLWSSSLNSEKAIADYDEAIKTRAGQS